MFTTSRWRWLIVVAAVAVVSLPVALLANHSWGGYHWARTSNPFTLKLGDNMTTADWKSYLAQASSDWNSPTNGLPTPLITAIVAGQAGRRCKMLAGTTQVCNGTYGNNGWLGLATINITGGVHITQGSAKMNDTYFNTSTYNNPNERQHVVCQEVAHTFGLDHQDTSGADFNTCMDYFSNTGSHASSTDSTRPNAGDFDELVCIYDPNYNGVTLTHTTSGHTHTCTGTGHLDSTTTVAASASAASAAGPRSDDNDDPNGWGNLVSQSANGRSSTYEADYGNGNKKVTHVYWTLEAAAGCPGCDHRYDH